MINNTTNIHGAIVAAIVEATVSATVSATAAMLGFCSAACYKRININVFAHICMFETSQSVLDVETYDHNSVASHSSIEE